MKLGCSQVVTTYLTLTEVGLDTSAGVTGVKSESNSLLCG